MESIISIDTIKTNIEVKTWKEAVYETGKLLLDVGYIEKKYIEAMIDKVEEFGPYVAIAPGIAMPHARPEDGVNKTGISIITLENPVNFGHEKNDPINLVIALAAADNKAHIEALSSLMTILGDDEKLENILNSKTPEELLNIII